MFITTNADLRSFCERAATSDLLAIDTEFLREKTYHAKLCLLQLGTEDEFVAVDPFTVTDWEPLCGLFRDPGIVKVFHACSQDMEVLLDFLGFLPDPVFDTQVASAYAGCRYQIGYGALVDELCHVSLSKSESMTDWSARPLDEAQLDYALDDVRYLPRIYHTLVERLTDEGRLEWLEPDFASLRDESHYRRDVRMAYRKVKRTGGFSRRQLAVCREVAAWREEAAIKADIPRRWVMSDELVAEISRRVPQSLGALQRLRGTSDLSPQVQRQVVEAVARGAATPTDQCPELPRHIHPTPEDESVVDLMYALTHMVSEHLGIASAILASRDDLMSFLYDQEDSTLTKGWRKDVLGKNLSELLDGKVGLTVKDRHVELL